jgi:hypothetical protein
MVTEANDTYMLRFTAVSGPPVTAAIHLVQQGDGWVLSCGLNDAGTHLNCTDDGKQDLAGFYLAWDRQ